MNVNTAVKELFKNADTKYLLEFAKLAEQAERYEDMATAMGEVVKQFPGMKSEERNLLSVAFKNVVGNRRSAWRLYSSIEQRKDNETEKKFISEEKSKVEKELKDICKEVLDLINDYLLPNLDDTFPEVDEARVFYHKMTGDYYRYICEISSGSERDDNIQLSEKAYKAATDIAEEKMPSTHPVRLGLALNFSVFFYEIKNKPEEACGHAKTAFDNAIAELDQLKEDSYKDSTLIMQLLRDNLTLWTSETQQEDEEQAAN